MKEEIPLALNLTNLLISTGELVGSEALMPSGLSDIVDGKPVRVYKYDVLLNQKDNQGCNTGEQETGDYVYYRHADLRRGLYKREYEAPMPFSFRKVYPGVERVHLVYMGERGERIDEFTEIPFP